MFMTKSKYVDYMSCINKSWLDKNRKDEKQEENLEDNIHIKEGLEVGALARNMFGDHVLIDNNTGESIPTLVKKTKEAIINDVPAIAEATFKYNNNICKVDMLVKNENEDTYSIYEVKATTNPYTNKKKDVLEDKYLYDISYQYYVLTKLGIEVTNCYIVYLNNEYVYNGIFILDHLFEFRNVTDAILLEYPNVENNIDKINAYINQKEEPEIICSKTCVDCPFNKHCYRIKGLPDKNSVLDLYGDRNKFKYLNDGIKSFKDLRDNNIKLSSFNQRMVDSRLDNLAPFVNKDELFSFLKVFHYPLYFFDFETFQQAIPTVENSSPYQQIPFQYSLHIMKEDGSLGHREHLASNYDEPRLDLIKQMINDLGKSGSIVAYHASFEQGRIQELARDFPEYSEQLTSLLDRFVDLEDVFKKGMYYKKEISRTSIKDILPSLFPDDSSLDYHNLKDVHKGDEASKAFLMLPSLDDEARNKLRESLLKYCCLDTFAMVKIFQFLTKLI